MFRYLIAVLATLTGFAMLGVTVFGDPAALSHAVRQALHAPPPPAQDAPATVDALRTQRDALAQQAASLRMQLAQLDQEIVQRRRQSAEEQAGLDSLRQQRAAVETQPNRPPAPTARVRTEPPPERARAEPPAEREPPPPPAPMARVRTEPPPERARAEPPPEREPPRIRAERLPPPPPRRPEGEEATAVLERLRQSGPEPPPPAREASPTGLASAGDSLSRVRAAIAQGQWEQAQRLLQVAQLQLVFRPVTPDGDTVPVLGRATAEVGRALSALGGGNARQADQHVARAMEDIAAAR